VEAVVDGALERWFTPDLAECRPDAVERTRRALLDTPPDGYAGCCEAIGSHDLRRQLGSIRAPTLVLAGADDPATPPEHGRLIADAVDGARFVLLDGARHLAVVERPEESARELLGHLTAGAAT
jgi:3-oxoadipate enol-lactonase